MKNKIKSNRVKGSPLIGFSEWNLDVKKHFDNLLQDMITEGMKFATENYECDVSFPFFWEEKDENQIIKSPSIIHVELPIGPMEGEHPAWEVDLSDAVARMIDVCDDAPECYALELEGIRKEFLRLAEKLDAALEKHRKPKEGEGNAN